MKKEASHQRKLFKKAYYLALFTIFYNVAEGIISAILGLQDESFALFGFGLDSFIEVISGLGILHMISRIQQQPESPRDAFEKSALQITGWAFYGLTAILTSTAIYHLYTGHKPQTTFWGVIISLISIAVMFVLVKLKKDVGKALASEPILSDANCTLVCVYMSIVLLLSSVIYAWTGFSFADSLGMLGLAYFSIKEGKECFEKARSDKYCGCH